MFRKYYLVLEAHKGYRPQISFRRAPRVGDRTNTRGTLITCPTCSGYGFLSLEGKTMIVQTPMEDPNGPQLP